jgi:hypothetical protein
MPAGENPFKADTRSSQLRSTNRPRRERDSSACSQAKGERSASTADFEKVTDKDAFVKALRDSLVYCDGVHLQSARKARRAE